MIIALDFDGTCCLHAFPEIGEVHDFHRDVHNKIRELKAAGHTIILWTCREDKAERAYLTEAVEWLKTQNVPVDYVNAYPNPGWSGFTKGEMIPCRKVTADIYIDDKALHAEEVNRLVLREKFKPLEGAPDASTETGN
jgi:hypothetical protein